MDTTEYVPRFSSAPEAPGGLQRAAVWYVGRRFCHVIIPTIDLLYWETVKICEPRGKVSRYAGRNAVLKPRSMSITKPSQVKFPMMKVIGPGHTDSTSLAVSSYTKLKF